MTSDGHDDQSGTLAAASARGRWLIVAAVLGSGVAFLDGTVVNVALPAIARDLDTDLRGQQWVLDGYMLTLSALLLVGGVAGDRYGRRAVFVGGLVVFASRRWVAHSPRVSSGSSSPVSCRASERPPSFRVVSR